MINIPTFGTKNRNATYKDRPGAYAVVLNDKNQLATVIMDNNYHFLPGGGQESGETILECLERELLEELGCVFTNPELVAVVSEYVKSFYDDTYYFITGHYFKISNFQIGGEPTDKSHEIYWMPLAESKKLLHRDAQKWVIEPAWFRGPES